MLLSIQASDCVTGRDMHAVRFLATCMATNGNQQGVTERGFKVLFRFGATILVSALVPVVATQIACSSLDREKRIGPKPWLCSIRCIMNYLQVLLLPHTAISGRLLNGEAAAVVRMTILVMAVHL